MKVHLNRIEQLPNDSAYIVFNTDPDNKFEFTVPKAFARSVTMFIVEHTFNYCTELFIEFSYYRKRDSMNIISRSTINKPETKIQVTQYILGKET